MCDQAIQNRKATVEILKTVSTTCYLCLSYVEGQLDQLFIENGHFHPNIQHMRLFDDVIRPALSIFELQCKMQRVKIVLSTNLSDDRLVQIDRQRTQQVIVNLINNSIRVAPSDSEIEVYVQYFSIDHLRTKLTIEVQDSGPGIAPEQKAHLFQPFQAKVGGG